MARKSKDVAITEEGRDKGKLFRITEMPAAQSERWAARALMAMAQHNAQLPEGIEKAGLRGIATLGLRALASIPFAEAEPLMDEMMTCIETIPDPSKPYVIRRFIDDDTEELATRLRLRAEVFKLHVDFSAAVANSISGATTANTSGSLNT